MTTENRTSEFHGITPVDGVYRVRAWSPEKWRTIGPDCGSLREALLERNRLWRDADEFTLKKIALRPQLMSGGNTNTGYARVSEELARREKKYFSLTIRDLLNGAWRHRSYRFETPRVPRSRDETLELVLELRSLHAQVCDLIILRYNAIARAECKRLAAAEAEDLVPRIHRLYEFSPMRWLKAREGLDEELLAVVNRLRDLHSVRAAVDQLLKNTTTRRAPDHVQA